MEKEVVSSHRISRIFGHGSARSTIISSASLALVCLFYVYTASTHLQVRVYPLIDRVTYFTPFNFYIVNEFVDHVVIGTLLVVWLAVSIRHRLGQLIIGVFTAVFVGAAATNYDPALDGIALSALPVIVAIVVYDHFSSRKILQNKPVVISNYLAVIGIIVGLISLGFAIASIAYAPNNEPSVMRSYAHDIFLLFSSLSPVLLLLLITSFPVKLLVDLASSKLRWKQQHLVPGGDKMSPTIKTVYLSVFMLLSIAIAIVPHLPTVNTDDRPVGVDTGYYVNWVGALDNAAGAQDFFYQAFVEQRDGDRPISLLFLFVLQKASGADLVDAIEYSPAILGPALVLAVYFLTRELGSSDKTSLLAAFLTAISFQVLIGIYAGFYANWIALTLGYVSFVFMFRYLKRRGFGNLGIFAALFVLTLFSHIYTWTVLAIAIGIFLAAVMMLRLNQYGRRNAAILMIVLLSTVVIDVARMGLTGSSGGIGEDIEIAGQLAGLDQFALRWNNLTYTTTVFVAGIFANFIILGLGLYWLVRTKMKEPVSIFIISFLSVGILPFLFGEWVIQTRVFYNMPFQIPAAIALFQITRKQLGEGIVRALPIYIWLIAMAAITVSNFYLVSPEQ